MTRTQSVSLLGVAAGQNMEFQPYQPLTAGPSGWVPSARGGRVDGITATPSGRSVLVREVAQGDQITVMDIAGGGIGLVRAGAAVAAGDVLVADGAGAAVGAPSIEMVLAGDVSFGVAVSGAEAGGVVQFIPQAARSPGHIVQFAAGALLADGSQFLAVSIDGAGTAVLTPDANAVPVGLIAEDETSAIAAGAMFRVRDIGVSGRYVGVAASAISVGQVLTAEAGGKVSGSARLAARTRPVGIAVTAADADGDLVQLIIL